MSLKCELCKKELTGRFAWVNCSFFAYHPKDECGGCEYPAGLTCVKQVQEKDMISSYSTVAEWERELKEYEQQKEQQRE